MEEIFLFCSRALFTSSLQIKTYVHSISIARNNSIFSNLPFSNFYRRMGTKTQNTNCACCFLQECVFIVAMVTCLLLGLQGSGELCPDRNGKTVISRKKFTIWHICTIKCTVSP